MLAVPRKVRSWPSCAARPKALLEARRCAWATHTMAPAMPSRRTWLLGVLAAIATSSRAQGPPRAVGLLIPGSDEFARKEYEAIARELHSLGYSEDRLTIVLRA